MDEGGGKMEVRKSQGKHYIQAEVYEVQAAIAGGRLSRERPKGSISQAAIASRRGRERGEMPIH